MELIDLYTIHCSLYKYDAIWGHSVAEAQHIILL